MHGGKLQIKQDIAIRYAGAKPGAALALDFSDLRDLCCS